MSEEIEEVLYSPDEDYTYEEEQIQAYAPRILAGQEDRQHWQAERPGGRLGPTTAEGALGKRLRHAARASRTDEEKFYDSVKKVASDADVPNAIRDSVFRLIPQIPDVGYKSAAGCIFGYMAKSLIGKNLSTSQKKELNKILEMVEKIKDRNQQISSLDICRYGRAWNIWLAR